MLWKNSLRQMNFTLFSSSDSKFLKFYLTNTSLTSTEFVLIRLNKSELLSDHLMALNVFRIACEIIKLLTCKCRSNGLSDLLVITV
jgi:hypothetical protein